MSGFPRLKRSTKDRRLHTAEPRGNGQKETTHNYNPAVKISLYLVALNKAQWILSGGQLSDMQQVTEYGCLQSIGPLLQAVTMHFSF